MFRAIILPIFRSTRLCVTACGPEDGQNNFPKHVELTGIINNPSLLHPVGCLYYLYQCCTAKQISDNEIFLLIKYLKSVLWRVAKRLSYIENARCLKINKICGRRMLVVAEWYQLRTRVMGHSDKLVQASIIPTTTANKANARYMQFPCALSTPTH